MSRTWSFGIPVTPVCQLGFGQPLFTTVREPCAALLSGFVVEPVLVEPLVHVPRVSLVIAEEVLLTTQLLAPPLPPIVSTTVSAPSDAYPSSKSSTSNS